jgi:hypothetical protein
MKPKTILRALPDIPDDSDATMDRLLTAASGEDRYWPRRVQGAFERAGFEIRHIQREECHQSVWTIWLTCGALALPKENKIATALVRRTLDKCGLKVRAGDHTVIEQRGDKLKCTFLFGPAGPAVDL